MKILTLISCIVFFIFLSSCELPINNRKIMDGYEYECILSNDDCYIKHNYEAVTNHLIIAYSHNEKYILAKGMSGGFDKELEKHNIRAFFDSAPFYILINHQTNEITGPVSKDSLVQILIEENQTELVSKPYDYINDAYLKDRL